MGALLCGRRLLYIIISRLGVDIGSNRGEKMFAVGPVVGICQGDVNPRYLAGAGKARQGVGWCDLPFFRVMSRWWCSRLDILSISTYRRLLGSNLGQKYEG